MCSDTIRDGSDNRRIPELNSGCLNGDCNTDFRFGMHEPNEYYQRCKQTSRNLGLFTADQVSNLSQFPWFDHYVAHLLFIETGTTGY